MLVTVYALDEATGPPLVEVERSKVGQLTWCEDFLVVFRVFAAAFQFACYLIPRIIDIVDKIIVRVVVDVVVVVIVVVVVGVRGRRLRRGAESCGVAVAIVPLAAPHVRQGPWPAADVA